MKRAGKKNAKALFCAFVASALITVLAPASALAEGQSQVAQSGWTKIICVVDKISGGAQLGDYYGWKIVSSVTVTDGFVSDVVVTAKGEAMASVPPTEKPYFEPCHYLMEEAIIDAHIDATNPDSVDDIDAVSGATSTSHWIKEATKEALKKWNENNSAASSVVSKIEAIASASDRQAAVKEARAAYDGLSKDAKGYIDAATYALLTDAEDALAAESVSSLIAALPASPGLADANQVSAARAAYEGLTTNQKSLVPADKLNKLVAAEKAVSDAEAAAQQAAAEANLANGTVKLAATKYTFANKAFKPAVTVKSKSGKTLKANTDYTVAYSNNKNAGTGKVTVTGTGAFNGTKSASFTIAKAAQTISPAKATYTAKYNKKKATKLKVAFKANGKGKLTWAAAKSGKVSIAKNGKVTIAKGAAKKVYKLKVKVTAAAKGNYAETTKTIVLKVRVR